MTGPAPRQELVVVRGGGEMASASARLLFLAGFRVVVLEREPPLAVRRKVAFAEAVVAGTAEVEGVPGRRVDAGGVSPALQDGRFVPVVVDPDGCLGLPTLAALEQGIAVIAVRENRNLMQNDLAELPWAPGQFHRAENYWEAAGLIMALKAGIAPETVRRDANGELASIAEGLSRLERGAPAAALRLVKKM